MMDRSDAKTIAPRATTLETVLPTLKSLSKGSRKANPISKYGAKAG
jgi:hypothetical protein